MSDKDTASKTAVVVSTAAAIAAGLAWLKSGKAAQAAPGDSIIPEELMELIIAIASDVEHIDTVRLQAILDAIAGISLNIQVQGWPPNVDSITSIRVQCAIAARAYQLPDIPVPDGMTLLIKGWPANVNLIYVAESAAAATNINQVWPLLPNEMVRYQVKNANRIWISAVAAGDWAVLTVEKKKGGA